MAATLSRRSIWLDRARDWASPATAGVVAAAVALGGLELSHDEAITWLALAAVGISFFNLWRAEFRGPHIAALLVDHPTSSVIGNALAVRFQVSQPLVVENTGGRPCVLAGVELVEPLVGGGNWWGAGVGLRDAVLPQVLRPGEPLIASLTFDLTAYATSPRGDRHDLAKAMENLRETSDLRPRIRIVYAVGERTREHTLAAQMNSQAIRKAFDDAQDKARYGGDDEPDLRMPGDSWPTA